MDNIPIGTKFIHKDTGTICTYMGPHSLSLITMRNEDSVKRGGDGLYIINSDRLSTGYTRLYTDIQFYEDIIKIED